MKSIVISDDFNEIDLKPSDLLKKYIQLTKEDALVLRSDSTSLNSCDCPGCGSSQKHPVFKKFNFQYQECKSCQTLYISPRPSEDVIDNHYKNSESRRFWKEKLIQKTDIKRSAKIVKPRIEWIVDSTQEHLPQATHWVDIHTNQLDYLEEMKKTEFFKKKTLLNPYFNDVNLKNDKSISVLNKANWQGTLENQVDVVSIFEVTEHLSDVDSFFKGINQILKSDGLCFITTTLSSGFDIQELWQDATSLYPPDRLNVLSREGWNSLFDRFDLKCLEFSTPGVLDLEIVEKAVRNDSDIKISRFAQQVVRSLNENLKREFQKFLQSNLLSSYGRIVLRKS